MGNRVSRAALLSKRPCEGSAVAAFNRKIILDWKAKLQAAQWRNYVHIRALRPRYMIRTGNFGFRNMRCNYSHRFFV
jgi:hypothetical protein